MEGKSEESILGGEMITVTDVLQFDGIGKSTTSWLEKYGDYIRKFRKGCPYGLTIPVLSYIMCLVS